MHQTTVRFTPELWGELSEAASASGVSAAQYVRDATLARLAFAAGERQGLAERRDGSPSRAADMARERALDVQSGAVAVTAQAALARERSRQLRERVRGGGER